MEEYVEIEAQASRTYLLPDSSKVWMQEGSSIRFSGRFKEHRDVWLEGNSLFEVHKIPGSKFRVHINNAFIEVKGTCFLVEQFNSGTNEITLFEGSIDFNIKSTRNKIEMKPRQKLVYNPADESIRLQKIENLNWKNGRYYFTRFNLEHLVRIMNQMHDDNPHVKIDSRVNKNCAFTGSIRFDESLEDVIDKICFTLNLQSKKKDNEISIHD